MTLINTAVKRPVAVWMMMLAIMLFGMVSFSRLAIKLLPDLSYPTLTIRTLYSGAAPIEIEQLVSKPVEEAVGIVKGLRKLSSISRAGMSDVMLEFEWGTDMDMAALDVREKLDTLMLPLDIEPPLLLRFNPNLDPIIRLALSQPEADTAALKRLRTYAEEELKRQLETLPGIASVRLSGGLEQEVHILLNQQKLAQLDITAQMIRDRIARENINLSAGKVVQGDKEFLVRTVNQFRSLKELGQVIVYRDSQKLIRLSDIADIIDGHKERSDITRIGNRESIELAIYKEGDANTVAVATRLRQALADMADQPHGRQLDLIYDQSEFIESAISEVTSAALLGSLLAMLVIYLFLRNIIATLIISVSIPFSVIATFNMMHFADISLNIMSLGGIALAVGLLVDNAIVVLENIDRCRRQGMDKLTAAITGTQDVAGAIFAATLTTLAVFIPLIFVDGIAGALFADQALTVTFALLASLLVALTAIPMLASRNISPAAISPHTQQTAKKSESKTPPKARRTAWHLAKAIVIYPSQLLFNYLPSLLLTLLLTIGRLIAWVFGQLMRPVSVAFNHLYHLLERCYRQILELALSHRRTTLVLAISASLGSMSLFSKLGVELIPPIAQSEFYVDIQLPPGTDVAQTDAVLQSLAQTIITMPAVKQIYTQAGSGGLMSADTNRSGENWGRVQVTLTDSQAFEPVAAALRQSAYQHPELNANITHPQLFSFANPLEIELSGYNLTQLKNSAADLVSGLSQSSRFTDINSSLKSGQPEISIHFDHQRIAALGLDAPTIATTVASRIGGAVASQYTLRDRKIDILIRSQLHERDQIQDIEQMIINPAADQPLPLQAIADVRLATGPSAINRINQQRVAIVSANLTRGDLSQAVIEAQQLIQQLSLPETIRINFSGQNEEMQASFLSLKIALLLAVCLVYLVMASQFESLLHPLFILLTVPMAMGGSMLGLYLAQTHLSVVVFIGLIMLAGIVVNNAIVLVDRINQLRAQGYPRNRAVRHAAHSRLRPIVMTTLTTSLGLLPMAIGLGDGSEIRAPMAIAVISGLLLSTLLTLVVIPVLYALFDKKSFKPTNEPNSDTSPSPTNRNDSQVMPDGLTSAAPKEAGQ